MILDSKYWADFCRKTGMPLDQIEINEEDWFNNRATFEYQFCFWPRRCYNTGQWLWLKTTVRGRREYFGLVNEPSMFEDRWYSSDEALIMMLKKVST